MKENQEIIDFIVRVKESYRKEARALSWEEKVASIERMNEFSIKAKTAMAVARRKLKNVSQIT